MILNKKVIKELGYELFENEWSIFKLDFSPLVKQLIESPYVLVPFNLEDSIQDFPDFLKIQKNDQEIFKSLLMSFMTIHDLRIFLYGEGESIAHHFPLALCEIDYILNNTYYLKDLGEEFSTCKLKVGQSKDFLDYYIVVNNNMLLFCQPGSENQYKVTLKYKHAIRNIELQIDRSNPRLICLVVKDQQKYKDYLIELHEVNKTTGMKTYLEETRKSVKNTEYILLDSYIDDLLNKWQY